MTVHRLDALRRRPQPKFRVSIAVLGTGDRTEFPEIQAASAVQAAINSLGEYMDDAPGGLCVVVHPLGAGHV